MPFNIGIRVAVVLTNPTIKAAKDSFHETQSKVNLHLILGLIFDFFSKVHFLKLFNSLAQLILYCIGNCHFWNWIYQRR
jgi:hypothetical protein